MSLFTFRGLMAPVFTPFHNDASHSINLDVIPAYSSYLAKNNIMGVLVNGSTGEGTSMTVREQEKVTEVWKRASSYNGQTIMIQIGGANLPNVLRLARHAESCQVDALLCLPEFHEPTTVSELIDYLTLVSNAAPYTPLLYYHVPNPATRTIKISDFLNKASRRLKNLVGIAILSPDLEEGAACLKAHNGAYSIFLVSGTLLSAGVALGYNCAIATIFNVLPQRARDIFDEVKGSDSLSTIIEHQKFVTSYIDVISGAGDIKPAMKAAMNILTDINVGEVRPPLVPLSDAEKAGMKVALNVLFPIQYLVDSFTKIFSGFSNN